MYEYKRMRAVGIKLTRADFVLGDNWHAYQ
jgi:hypothetical protein